MLDTSYGFNNLLKEVLLPPLRDTNTSPDSKKSSSKTSMPARTSAPKSSAPSVPLVTPLHSQNASPVQPYPCNQ